MNTERPVIDEAKVKGYLKGSSCSKRSKKPSQKCIAVDTAKKVETTVGNQPSAKRVVTKDQEQVVKFMMELPAALRRKIKLESVSSDEPMNSLIVRALSKHFG